MIINVLGEEYVLVKSNAVSDPKLEHNDGYCDHTVKMIVIDTFQETELSVGDLAEYEKQVIRHELIHAFLHESGLSDCSWAKNEEIVDWIALQFPKMMKVFEEHKCL